MSETTNAYLICGVEINGEPTAELLRAGLGSLQHSVEGLILEGYRPVGGVAVISAPDGVHLTQAVFREPAQIQRVGRA